MTFLCSVQVMAQSPNLIWAKTYGDTSFFSQSLDCAVDNLGNLYTVGYTNYWPHGDFLIIKYNTTTGDTLWTRTFNGNPGDTINDNDMAFGCVADGLGNLYVTGMSSNSDTNTNFDFLTIKYNTATGDTIWTSRYNGNGAATECALDGLGNLYVAGISSNGSNSDFLIIKYNTTTGDTIWTRRYNSPFNNNDEAYGCAVNGSNIFVNGL